MYTMHVQNTYPEILGSTWPRLVDVVSDGLYEMRWVRYEVEKPALWGIMVDSFVGDRLIVHLVYTIQSLVW